MICKICESLKTIKDDPYYITELETGYVVLKLYQRFKGYTIFECKVHAEGCMNLNLNTKRSFFLKCRLLHRLSTIYLSPIR